MYIIFSRTVLCVQKRIYIVEYTKLKIESQCVTRVHTLGDHQIEMSDPFKAVWFPYESYVSRLFYPNKYNKDLKVSVNVNRK